MVMWITTNVVMWIALLKGGNVDYHQCGNPIMIIIIIIVVVVVVVVIVVIKHNINYYQLIIMLL